MSKHDEWIDGVVITPENHGKNEASYVYEHDLREYLAKLDAENEQLRKIIRTTKAMGFYVVTADSGGTHRAVAKAVEQALKEKDKPTEALKDLMKVDDLEER